MPNQTPSRRRDPHRDTEAFALLGGAGIAAAGAAYFGSRVYHYDTINLTLAVVSLFFVFIAATLGWLTLQTWRDEHNPDR